MNSKRKGKAVADAAALALRRDALKARWYRLQLERAEAVLDAAGVPKWVTLPDDPTPAACVADRLRWFVIRRKDVTESERRTDQAEREMRLALEDVKRSRINVTQS